MRQGKTPEFFFKFFLLIILISMVIISASDASNFTMLRFSDQQAADLDEMFKRARDLAFRGQSEIRL
jgi:hypothetical protein